MCSISKKRRYIFLYLGIFWQNLETFHFTITQNLYVAVIREQIQNDIFIKMNCGDFDQILLSVASKGPNKRNGLNLSKMPVRKLSIKA